MGGIVSGIFGGGDDAADAAKEGAQITAEGQEKALEYLKQQERLPTAYREQALSQLGMLYGLPGISAGGQQQPYATQQTQPLTFEQFVGQTYSDQPSYYPGMEKPEGLISRRVSYALGQNPEVNEAQQREDYNQYLSSLSQPQGMTEQQESFSPLDKAAFVEALRQDPFYESMLQQGEEAVLRGSSATGGLRSGTASENLARNSQNVLQGYYNQQVQGLQGLAQQPSNANAIASQMAGIGQTLGQGQIASAQAQQAGQQQGVSNLMGLGGLGLAAYSAFSDRRLKDNIRHIDDRKGHKWYKWTWNKFAEDLGLSGDCEGVMADEIKETNPEAVGESNGYMTVDYLALGV